MRSLIALEMRRGPGALTALLAAAANGWFVSRELPEGVWLWSATSAALPGAVLVSGPLVAAAAAFAAMRNGRNATLAQLERTGAVSPVRGDMAALGAMVLWGWAGYATALAGACVATALNATWAGPSWPPLLAGFPALLACAVIGFAAGRWFPSLSLPPIVATGTWLVSGIALSLEAPLAWMSPAFMPGWHPVVDGVLGDMAGPRALWFGGATLAGVGLVLVRRHVVRLALLSCTGACLCGGIALASAPGQGAVRAVPTVADVEPDCAPGAVEVCVHPAYAGVLNEVRAALTELAEPVAGLGDAPARLVQDGVLDASERRSTATFQVVDLGDGLAPVLRSAAVGLVSSRPLLEEFGGDPAADPEGFATYLRDCVAARFAVADWLLLRVGVEQQWLLTPAVTGALARELDDVAMRPWLRENLGELRSTCMPIERLPRPEPSA